MQHFLIGYFSGVLSTLAFIGLAAIMYKPPAMPPTKQRRPF